MTNPNIDPAEFLRESVVDVDAAVVGIAKHRWIGLSGVEATQERAAALMKERSFDVLPIIDGEEVKRYFRTSKWNDYRSISQRNITHKDVIPSQTGIREVIKAFAVEEDRDFYFLARERRINGLISIVNLNCRQVKVYLFSLMCELEISLADFISRTSGEKQISEDTLRKIAWGSGNKPKHASVVKRYESDKSNGVDVPFVEYLYLSDLNKIVANTSLHEDLGFDSPTSFKKTFRPFVDLRDMVAHPVRSSAPHSIVTDVGSVKTLWRRIDGIEEALFKLRGI